MAKILAVDDSPTVLKIVRLAMSSLGHSVTICNSGEEAIRLIEDSKDFDLGIFDYNLPGISGISLIKKALALQSKRNFKIIVLSSENNQTLVDEALEVGASGWVHKPFENQELINLINSLVTE
ncbi:response regulator [Leptospira sp. 96542]|nr:response regulator [Leptospira sp. 96542]